MGLGLLFSAISGAANGTSEELGAQQKVADRLDINQAKSDADLQRQKALSTFALDQANANRASQAKKFQDSYQGLLHSKIEANVNRIEGNEPGTADYVPFSAMSQAEKDQGAPDKLSIMLQAGGQTAQLSPAQQITSLAAMRSAAAAEEANIAKGDLADKTLAETAKHNRATERNTANGLLRADGKGKSSAMTKNFDYLKNKGWSDDKIANYLSESKHKSVGDITVDILRGDPNKTVEEASAQAKKIYDLSRGIKPPPTIHNIDGLIANPSLAPKFNEKFGPGAAEKVLAKAEADKAAADKAKSGTTDTIKQPTAKVIKPKRETYAEGIKRQERELKAEDAKRAAEKQASDRAAAIKEADRKSNRKNELQTILTRWQAAHPNPEPRSNAYNRIHQIKSILSRGNY